VGAGINTRIGWGLPLWVGLVFGVPGVIGFVYGLYLGIRARKMKVQLDEDGLRCSDWLGRTESVAWSEVEGLTLWRRTIPYSSGALDLTWRDVRGQQHTRRIGSFKPPRGWTMTEEVSDLVDAIEERLDLQRSEVDRRSGRDTLLERWDRQRAAK
jgi:hypothetical protein